MEHYAGIDVSLESASICVVDASGRIVREAKVASEPEVLIGWFGGLRIAVARIGLEAGPLSQWLYAGMRDVGLPVELLETRHVRAAFKAMPVKTDRKDARGIAQLMRLGWFRPVHCKSRPAQEVRALLAAPKLLQTKNHDVEMSLRGVLRGFGMKVGRTTPRTFRNRIRELVAGHLASFIPPKLSRDRDAGSAIIVPPALRIPLHPPGSPLPMPALLLPSVSPEVLEPIGGKLAVAHGMLNVLVTEVMLQRARIDAVVREFVCLCRITLEATYLPNAAWFFMDARYSGCPAGGVLIMTETQT
jgi:hypothetical protein